MSDRFVRRLKSVQSEYDAAREAIAYVDRYWQKLNISAEIGGITPKQFTNAANSLETIFIIRLFSTFEGVLKEHLAKNHPTISVPEDARAVWLIDRVANRQTPRINAPLVSKVHDVRKYRNSLVHVGGPVPCRIIFTDALAALAKFCDWLPDPPY